MVKYLQMDGVDDYLKLNIPVTYTKIEIDMQRGSLVGKVYFSDSGSASIYEVSNGEDKRSSFQEIGVIKDGVKTVGNSFNNIFSPNERGIIYGAFTNTTRSANYINFFTNPFAQSGNMMDGSIYDIKVWNDTILLAHYDMSTGTVQDQSGNGNHATLTGGTWLDDGTGGGGTEPIAHTKQLSDSVSFNDTYTKLYRGYRTISDAVLTSDVFYKQLTLAVLDAVNTSEPPTAKRNHRNIADSIVAADSLNQAGGNSTELSDYITITDTLRKTLTKVHSDAVTMTEQERESLAKHLFDSMSQTDVITTSKGKAVVLSDSLLTSDSLRKLINKASVDSVTSVDSLAQQSAVSVRLYDVILTTDSVRSYLPNVPEYHDVIQLTLNIAQGQSINLAIVRRDAFELAITQREVVKNGGN